MAHLSRTSIDTRQRASGPGSGELRQCARCGLLRGPGAGAQSEVLVDVARPLGLKR